MQNLGRPERGSKRATCCEMYLIRLIMTVVIFARASWALQRLTYADGLIINADCSSLTVHKAAFKVHQATLNAPVKAPAYRL